MHNPINIEADVFFEEHEVVLSTCSLWKKIGKRPGSFLFPEKQDISDKTFFFSTLQKKCSSFLCKLTFIDAFRSLTIWCWITWQLIHDPFHSCYPMFSWWLQMLIHMALQDEMPSSQRRWRLNLSVEGREMRISSAIWSVIPVFWNISAVIEKVMGVLFHELGLQSEQNFTCCPHICVCIHVPMDL